tara:strand:+ start:44 stop:406 length:363 start_codon:yes stop_codon:yes gene_type:complete
MNHINVDNDFVKSLIAESHWNKVGLTPVQEQQEVVEEATEEVVEEQEENEELTLEDLEALLSVFPDNVLEEHVLSVAQVLNEAYEEEGELVEEEDEDEDYASELIDSIVDQTLEDLTDEE